MRHPAEDLVLLQVLGDRDLDRAVERQLAVVDLLAGRRPPGARAKSHSSTLRRNRLRVISIFLARPISWSRVSSGISPICVRYIRTGSSIRREISSRSSGVSSPSSSSTGSSTRSSGSSSMSPEATQAGLGLVLVDQLDAQLVERLEQAVDLLGATRLVGQVVVDLVEGQETPALAQVEERLEALVQLFHPEISHRDDGSGRGKSPVVVGTRVIESFDLELDCGVILRRGGRVHLRAVRPSGRRSAPAARGRSRGQGVG